MRKKIVSPRKFVKPSYAALIEKKRDGNEFSEEEIRFLVDSVLDREIPDSQLAALLMAIYFQGMAAAETATFAEEIMLSGEMVDLTKLSRPKIDKFSTGGVGDKTSLVLGPLAAACGVVMPTINGVDEEMEISTREKLSAIKGFKSNLEVADFRDQLSKVGCAIMAQNDQILSLVNMSNKFGLIAIGLGLILGVLTRYASVAGVLLLALYYAATPPFIGFTYTVPMEGSYMIVNKNMVEALAIIVLMAFPTGRIIGLDRLLFPRKIS